MKAVKSAVEDVVANHACERDHYKEKMDTSLQRSHQRISIYYPENRQQFGGKLNNFLKPPFLTVILVPVTLYPKSLYVPK